MEKVFICFGVFVLVMSLVFAADNLSNASLGDENVSVVQENDVVNSSNGSSGEEIIKESSKDSVREKVRPTYPVDTESLGNPEDANFYTSSFYIALVIGILVLIGFGVLIWFLIRGPRNSWEKKKSLLHGLGKKEKVPKG